MLDETIIRDLSTSVSALESHRRLAEVEITNMRVKVDAHIATTQEQFKSLVSTMAEIRDMARDNRNITIGFDGNNGLRGNLASLVHDVTVMAKDFEFLRQTANSYSEMKTWFVRLLITSVCAIVFQLAGGLWSINMQNAKQDSLRDDILKVTAFIEKQQKMYGLSEENEEIKLSFVELEEFRNKTVYKIGDAKAEIALSRYLHLANK